jgi:hypothetical protein
MLIIEGHAIVSTDGMIADGNGEYPEGLRNEADWSLYQEALDAAAIVVLGRRGHQHHPNPGRRRLVVTRSVERLDEREPNATFWNPAGVGFDDVLAELGVTRGTVAITGLFDLFIPHYDRFVLSERNDFLLPGGTPCFSAGHPRQILARAGLVPQATTVIDAAEMVTATRWQQPG